MLDLIKPVDTTLSLGLAIIFNMTNVVYIYFHRDGKKL